MTPKRFQLMCYCYGAGPQTSKGILLKALDIQQVEYGKTVKFTLTGLCEYKNLKLFKALWE